MFYSQVATIFYINHDIISQGDALYALKHHYVSWKYKRNHFRLKVYPLRPEELKQRGKNNNRFRHRKPANKHSATIFKKEIIMVNEKGIIIPSAEDMNKAIGQLINGIQNDVRVNIQFRTSPVDYFRSIGLPSDAVSEIMKELGLRAEAGVADTGGCSYTCIWTCSYTSSSFASISLKATATPLQQG